MLSNLRFLVIEKSGLNLRIISTVPLLFLGVQASHWCRHSCLVDFGTKSHSDMSQVPEPSVQGDHKSL